MAIEEFVKEAKKILKVSSAATVEYQNNAERMLNFVNHTLSTRSDIFKLIGGNPLQVMYDKHRDHVNFMSSIFKYLLSNFLVKVTIWNYKVYINHGFSREYFSIELNTWIEAIRNIIPSDYQSELISVYDWLLKRQAEMIEISRKVRIFDIKLRNKLTHHTTQLLAAILKGDNEKALEIAKEFFRSLKDVSILYNDLIQPVMYRVGFLWECGKITVAEEHLATSIVSRILAILYEEINKFRVKIKHKAVVTAAPNEYHELGARMLADLLEAEGWKVYYLGANVPEGGVISTVEKVKPELLCVSVTMIYNIEKAESIIREVKKMKTPPKVMVGGLAFNLNPGLYKRIGADLWAKDVKSAIRKIKPLFKVRH